MIISELAKHCAALRKSIREKELMLQTAALSENERRRRKEAIRNERVLLRAREEALASRLLAEEKKLGF